MELLDPEDETNTIIWNSRNYLQKDTASYPRSLGNSGTKLCNWRSF